MEQNDTLHNLASKDQLTKLYNRRSADEALSKAYDEAILTQQIFSIVICDIDDFKIVNDTYGHQCGDFVFSTVSSIILSNIREIDTACRWVGKNF